MNMNFKFTEQAVVPFVREDNSSSFNSNSIEELLVHILISMYLRNYYDWNLYLIYIIYIYVYTYTYNIYYILIYIYH